MLTPTIRRLLRSTAATALVVALAAGSAQAAAPRKASHDPGATAASAAHKGPTDITYAWVRSAQLFTLGGHNMTLAGRTLHVNFQEAPYVGGQHVTLFVSVNGHVIRHFTTQIKHGPHFKYGWLAANVTVRRQGHITVSVLHRGTRHLVGFDSHVYYYTLASSANYGATGMLVGLVQHLLAAQHIYIHQDGVFDAQTQRALEAYHRLMGLGSSFAMDPTVVNDLVDGRGTFHVLYPNQGRHAEGDLTDQVLALVDGSKVWAIFPISSGKQSTPTILGSYQIYERVPGYLPDGMYYSDFFIRGYAIHGYNPSPTYPASHGCMRLWMPDAIPVYNWLALGDWVDTYGNAPFNWNYDRL